MLQVTGSGRDPLNKIEPGIKLWLSLAGTGVFGHGKWQLLEAIDRKGSLQAAADLLGRLADFTHR